MPFEIGSTRLRDQQGDRAPTQCSIQPCWKNGSLHAPARGRPKLQPCIMRPSGRRVGFPNMTSNRAELPLTGHARFLPRAGSPCRSIRARVQPHPIARLSGRGRTSQRHRCRRQSVPMPPRRVQCRTREALAADDPLRRQSLQGSRQSGRGCVEPRLFPAVARTPRLHVRKTMPAPTPNAVPLGQSPICIDRRTLRSAPKSHRF